MVKTKLWYYFCLRIYAVLYKLEQSTNISFQFMKKILHNIHHYLSTKWLAVFLLLPSLILAQTFSTSVLKSGLSSSYGSDTGDLDGDNDIDIVAVGMSSTIVRWFENDGNSNPSFQENGGFSFSSYTGPSSAKIADLDGDGDNDIIVSM